MVQVCVDGRVCTATNARALCVSLALSVLLTFSQLQSICKHQSRQFLICETSSIAASATIPEWKFKLFCWSDKCIHRHKVNERMNKYWTKIVYFVWKRQHKREWKRWKERERNRTLYLLFKYESAFSSLFRRIDFAHHLHISIISFPFRVVYSFFLSLILSLSHTHSLSLFHVFFSSCNQRLGKSDF